MTAYQYKSKKDDSDTQSAPRPAASPKSMINDHNMVSSGLLFR